MVMLLVACECQCCDCAKKKYNQASRNVIKKSSASVQVSGVALRYIINYQDKALFLRGKQQ